MLSGICQLFEIMVPIVFMVIRVLFGKIRDLLAKGLGSLGLYNLELTKLSLCFNRVEE